MLTGTDWIDVILVAAAIAAAVYTLWRRVFRPLIRAVEIIADTVPVLVDIAQEFQPDHGTSLRDVVDRIDSTLSVQTQAVEDHIVEDRENFRKVGERLSLQDIALHNIQQAQVDDVAGETPESS